MQNLASNAELAADLVAGPAARYAELVRETLLGGGKLLYVGNGRRSLSRPALPP
jgi:hypothetical protein